MEDAARRKTLFWILGILASIALCGGGLFVGRQIAELGRQGASEVAEAVASLTPSPQPTATSTSTIPPPTPTITETPFWVIPTATQTIIPWSQCPGIVLSSEDTDQGDFLKVQRCSDGLEYKLGPLSKGTYAVSPDEKYLVYVSLDGILYAAKIGAPYLTVIKNLKKEGEFTVFPKKVNPIFRLTFTGNTLEIYETKYNQNMPVVMPGWLSQ